jgi:hypothetical protein
MGRTGPPSRPQDPAPVVRYRIRVRLLDGERHAYRAIRRRMAINAMRTERA